MPFKLSRVLKGFTISQVGGRWLLPSSTIGMSVELPATFYAYELPNMPLGCAWNECLQ